MISLESYPERQKVKSSRWWEPRCGNNGTLVSLLFEMDGFRSHLYSKFI